jgi:hypothetical protein
LLSIGNRLKDKHFDIRQVEHRLLNMSQFVFDRGNLLIKILRLRRRIILVLGMQALFWSVFLPYYPSKGPLFKAFGFAKF